MAKSIYSRVLHRQTEPAATWVIAHSKGVNPGVSVAVYEDGTLTAILPRSITFPDQSTVEIEFSSPRTGEAVLI